METAEQQQVVLPIGGMACSGCANTVQQALEKLDGVKEVTVDLNHESATVTFDPKTITAEALGQAVEEAGYSFKHLKQL